MKLKKVLCGVTAAVLIFGALTSTASADFRWEEMFTQGGFSEFTKDGITYKEDSNRALMATDVSSDITDLVIPETVNGKKVVAICINDIESDSIRSVSIPKSVVSIWRKNTVQVIDYYECAYFGRNCAKITVDPENPKYFAKDGVLFYRVNKEVFLASYPAGKKASSYSIPDGVFGFGVNAFENCPIETLNIPASVESAGPLGSEYKIKNINVDAQNKSYCSIDGVMFNKDKTFIFIYPSGRSGENYIIPDGIKDIYDLNADFDSLYIPTSVTRPPVSFTAKDVYYAGSESQFKKIEGDYREAFINLYDYCRENNITVHYNADKPAPSFTKDGITYVENKDGTLTASVAENARKIMPILNVPETVDGKKVTVFSMIEGVYNAGFGPTYNGYTLPELKSISLPASLKEFEICEQAMEPLLPKLTEIKVDPQNTVLYAEDNVLFKKHDKGITMVLYPAGKTDTSYTIPEGVTDSDFLLALRNDHLKTLNFPSSLAYIGDGMSQGAGRPLYVGYYFANLNEINVDPNNKVFASVDGNLYDKGMNLLIKYSGKDVKTFIVPDGVSKIDHNKFEGQTIYIPKSVGDIGWGFLMSGNIKDIYYAGSEEEWNKIIALGDFYNDIIAHYIGENAIVHYNMPAPKKPAIPAKPDTPSVTTKEVTLTWDKVEDATAYLIKLSFDGGKTWFTQTVPENSLTLSNLTPDTAYLYRIASKNGDIESGFSEEYSFKTEKEGGSSGEESSSGESSKSSKHDRDDDDDKDNDSEEDSNPILMVIIIAAIVVAVVIAAAVVVVILVLKKKKQQ